MMQQINAEKQKELEAKPTLNSFAAIKQRFSRGGGGLSSSGVSEMFNSKENAPVEVEEDPLDAYMTGIEKNAAK